MIKDFAETQRELKAGLAGVNETRGRDGGTYLVAGPKAEHIRVSAAFVTSVIHQTVATPDSRPIVKASTRAATRRTARCRITFGLLREELQGVGSLLGCYAKNCKVSDHFWAATRRTARCRITFLPLRLAVAFSQSSHAVPRSSSPHRQAAGRCA